MTRRPPAPVRRPDPGPRGGAPGDAADRTPAPAVGRPAPRPGGAGRTGGAGRAGGAPRPADGAPPRSGRAGSVRTAAVGSAAVRTAAVRAPALRAPATTRAAATTPAAPAPPGERGAAPPPVASRSGRAAPAAPAPRRTRLRRALVRPLAARRSRVVAALVALLVLAGAGWALLASPLTALERVTVSGAVRTDPAAVEAAAAAQLGTPLLRLDAEAVRERLSDRPYVAGVELVRRWPRAAEVVVAERVPVAAVPGEGGFALLDAEGAVITTEGEVPPELPVVEVDVASAGAPALRAAGRVARGLPAALRAEVERVGAGSPDDVRLTLRGGVEVRWGSAEQSAAKAQVLGLLRTRVEAAAGYDVSAPEAPATW